MQSSRAGFHGEVETRCLFCSILFKYLFYLLVPVISVEVVCLMEEFVYRNEFVFFIAVQPITLGG